ncbi:MAG TPA: DUF2007 domain-containing protein [Telluria sp.]|nr:DUF2007 domain-containing protein [Telluria sp.]
MSATHAGSAGIAGECSREAEAPTGRDLFTVASYYDPTQAHIVQGCLAAAGIPAVVADDNLVQANSLWTAAVGGVRIRVPEAFMAEAKAVIEAFDRGEFALKDDDVEAGGLSPPGTVPSS